MSEEKQHTQWKRFSRSGTTRLESDSNQDDSYEAIDTDLDHLDGSVQPSEKLDALENRAASVVTIMDFPRYSPMEWVWDCVACQFPEAPLGASKLEQDERRYRPENWFHEYVRQDRRSGKVSFDTWPPYIPQGRIERLRTRIQDLLNGYELLYKDSAEATLRSCYIGMNGRDLSVDMFQVPWSTNLIGGPFFLGAKVVSVPETAFLGALTTPDLAQYEPLAYEELVWGWHNEGPISLLERFGLTYSGI